MSISSVQTRTRTALASAGIGVAAFASAVALALPAAADNPHQGQGQGQGNGQGNGNSNGNGHNPAGNNGTVFIHDVADDHTPHNVPHVGCTFYVDFFGFDNGQSVTVSFAGQAPTGPGTPLTGGWSGVISTDDASGAGQDWDYEQPVTLDTTPLGTPAHQGFHVKMTVDTNEPGGHKYKVFWVQPCESVAAPTSGSATAPTTTTTTTTGTENTSSTPGGVLANSTTHPARTTSAGQTSGGAVLATSLARHSGQQPAEVLGEHFTRGAVAPAATTTGALPFTGAEIAGLVLAGALVLGTGIVLTVLGRRRRLRATYH